ncbi:MAG TPA: phosphotransferase [Acidimicrobiia bacterium]|nr:phosphotransferase [Acidimicrobiia bacterium]
MNESMIPITGAEASSALTLLTGGDEVIAMTGYPHVVAETASGSHQRAFVKTFQPGSDQWRAEVDVYESGLLVSLVDGLRAPRLLKVIDLAEGGVRLWLEEVVTTDLAWTPARVIEAAGLLGRMSRLYLNLDEDPPLPVRGMVDGDLPASFGHGDSRRSNFLAEGADPHRFVLIEWAQAGWWPVGSDLAPLLGSDNSLEEEAVAAFCEAGFEPEIVAAGYRRALAALNRA